MTVVPAKAGTHNRSYAIWVPAFAGTSGRMYAP